MTNRTEIARRLTAEAVGTALLLATALFRWLTPALPQTARAVVVPRRDGARGEPP